MTTVLVTGGIGSGKSAVCSLLSRRGYAVYDCDSRCKALYTSIPCLIPQIEDAVGLPFCRLSEVFSDGAALKRLEDTVYPYLLADIGQWKETVDSGICFVESAIALSKPCFNGVYDRVLVVSAPLELRMERNVHAALRSGFQDTRLEDKADYLIINDSSLGQLESRVEEFIKCIENEN